MFESFSMTRKV